MKRKENRPGPEKWIFISIPVLFIVACLLHLAAMYGFGYTLLGYVIPVNESVWEHLKLLYFPLLIWWFFQYIFQHKKYDISKRQWIAAAGTSILTAMLFVIAFYYSYTGALGFESVLVDMIGGFLALAVAQTAAVWVYKNAAPGRITATVFLLMLLFFIAAFFLFTMQPPELPIFMA